MKTLEKCTLLLGVPLLDYVRATSKAGTFMDVLAAYLATCGQTWDNTFPTKFLQYNCVGMSSMSGTVLAGNADASVIGGRVDRPDSHLDSHIIQVTSDLASWNPIYDAVVVKRRGNVTRLDMQVTVNEPSRYDAYALYDQLRAGASTTTIIEGATGSTVYVGSRMSDKMLRVYQKVDGEGKKLLRAEFELKRDMAKEVVNQLRAGESLTLMYNYLINKTGNEFLIETFTVGVAASPVRCKKPTPNTVRWFLDTVIPSLAKLKEADREGYNEVVSCLRNMIDNCDIQ